MQIDIKLFFTKLDASGASKEKIDTLLEYKCLGDYLNGSYTVNVDKQYNELTPDEQGILQNLYNAAKEFFSNIKIGENLPAITDENVLEYANIEGNLSHNETSLNDFDKITLKNIRMALNSYFAQNGIQSIDDEANKYNSSSELIMRDIDINNDTFDYNYVARRILEQHKNNKINEEIAQKTLKFLTKPSLESKLKNIAETYINENEIQPLKPTEENIDLGNGKFDKNATQKTEICWALASINGLLTTEEGKKLLNDNSYYDEKTGNFVIHLQEAEDNNLHDGCFIITPEDIINEGPSLLDGEGDIAAYMIAIKHYFEEINKNPELFEKMKEENRLIQTMDKGNYGIRFFEIMTGGKHVKYKSSDDLKLQNGIGAGSTATLNFDFIKDIVQNKKGVVTLAISGHSISIIDVKDDNLIIQESNNNEIFDEEFIDSNNNHKVFNQIENINNAPTYTLSRYDYEGYIQQVSYLKWRD